MAAQALAGRGGEDARTHAPPALPIGWHSQAFGAGGGAGPSAGMLMAGIPMAPHGMPMAPHGVPPMMGMHGMPIPLGMHMAPHGVPMAGMGMPGMPMGVGLGMPFDADPSVGGGADSDRLNPVRHHEPAPCYV